MASFDLFCVVKKGAAIEVLVLVIILLNHSAWYCSEWLHLAFSSWSRAGELIEVPILGIILSIILRLNYSVCYLQCSLYSISWPLQLLLARSLKP